MSSEWPSARLSELCLLVVDCPHSTPVWTGAGKVVLRNQNIKGGRLDLTAPSFTDEEHFAGRIRRAAPTAGDIVITREAPMGEVCMIPAGLECCLGQRQVLLRPNTSRVDGPFLLYALQSPGVQHQIGWNEGTGSTVSNLRIPVLESLNVTVPPMEVQKGISSSLGAIDERITLLRETNTTLEAIAQALFKSWFVDFDPVRAKMAGRAPESMDEATAAFFPDRFEDSNRESLPESWKRQPFSEWISVLETGRRPKGGVAGIDRGVPSIGAESIVKIGQFDYSKVKFVSADFFANMKAGKLLSRDVLLYKDGGKPGVFLPRVSMFGDGFPFETCGINEHVFRIRVKAPLGQTFLYFWLWSDAVMHELKHRGGKAAIPGINQADVRELQILVPPHELLKRYEEISEPMVGTILNNSKRITVLTELRDILLPRLISGQLRPPEATEAVDHALATTP